MHIVKRITKNLKAKRRHIDVAEVQALSDHLRKDIHREEDILKFLGRKNFGNLVDVAKYTDFGVFTAVQAAFCMGYKAKETNQKDVRKAILQLDDIIQSEYDAMSELEIEHKLDTAITALLEEKLSDNEYEKVRDNIFSCIMDAEFTAFRQGFIRGIAAGK